MCERRFGDADQVVAMDTAVVFEPVINTDSYLRGKATMRRINGCTNNRGIFGVKEHLAAYDYKDTVSFRVVR
jgi:hypothetical protein